MAHTPAPEVFLHLPDGRDREALRAGLLAMRCIPVNLPDAGRARATMLDKLAQRPQAWVFADISNPLPRVVNRFEDSVHTWPKALRGRTVLTRLAAGHVAQADRVWVREQGFVDLLAGFEGADQAPALRSTLNAVASTCGLPAVTEADLQRYLSAVLSTAAPPSPRRTIRTHTGLGAEALTEWLQAELDIRDRSHRLKPYPACFVGNEAVNRIAEHFRLTREAAVEVGRALGTLGLLHHVVHEHAFEDATLFYRLRAPDQLKAVPLSASWHWLRAHLVVKDRSHLGTTYPACWVGQDAVGLLSERLRLARHDSLHLLHRLMQFGCFEHVVQEHGIIDGPLFYRCTRPTP